MVAKLSEISKRKRKERKKSMGKDFFTVKEFAAKVKVSPQSIYKRLKNKNDDLQPFVKKDGAKTMIAAAAIGLYFDTPAAEDKQEAERDTPTVAEFLAIIAEKDKQILSLLERLKEANTAILQQQHLHAIDKARIAELEAPKEKDKEEEIPKKKKGFFSLFRK